MLCTSEIIKDVPAWNVLHLAKPPEVFLEYSEAELAAVRAACAGLSGELADGLATDLQALCNELHLLRSVAYRVGNQFSNCRAFRVVRAVTGCGRRLRQVVEPGWVSGRVAALARPCGRSLPSRQLAQHLLVTCQRAGCLLGRLAALAEQAARLWLQWLRLGHQAPLAVAFLGLLGRVWTLSGAGCRRLCRLYAAVRPVEAVLRAADVPWPHSPLPDCLWSWLGVPVSDEDPAPSARGPSRSARYQRDHTAAFEDQARELTVSLLPPGTGEPHALPGPSSSERAEVRDSSPADDSPVLTEDLGDRLFGGGELTSVEDLGEAVDDADMLYVSPPALGDEDGGAALPDGASQKAGDAGAEVATTGVDVSEEDRKLYRRVNKLTRGWTSPEDVAAFVTDETAARRQHRKGCVTARLSQAQWKCVKQGLRERRTSWSKREKCGDQPGVEKWAKRSRLFLKVWSLFPSSEGAKPAEWADFLDDVKNRTLP